MLPSSRQLWGNVRTRRMTPSHSKMRHGPLPFDIGLPSAYCRTVHRMPSAEVKTIDGAIAE
jgi:hypothetical protein